MGIKIKQYIKSVAGIVATLVLVVSFVPAQLAQAYPGEVTRYDTPTEDSYPRTVTIGPDGNVWFPESSSNKIGKLDPSTGSVTEYDIPTGSMSPDSIITGSDGNLWFKGWSGKIGKIDPNTGNITEYEVPVGPVYAITSGPDGNIWFTSQRSHDADGLMYKKYVNKFDINTHEFTEYEVADSNNGSWGLLGITTGSDGSLWFTMGDENAVGKFNPETEEHTIYVAPNDDARPGSITTGLDGSLWFTKSDYNSGKIAKVDPSTGEITEYPLPTATYSWPDNIIAGPDGRLWFTGSNDKVITAFDPETTAITEYDYGEGWSGGFTFDSDDNIWLALSNDNKIGRLEMPPPGFVAITDISLSNTLLNTGKIKPGDSVQYKLTITNEGNTAVSKRLYPASIYPAWLDFEGASGSNCSPLPEDAGIIEMMLPNHIDGSYRLVGCSQETAMSLAPGEQKVITLTFRANQTPVAGLDTYATVGAEPGYSFEDDKAIYDLYNPELWSLGVDDFIDEFLDGKLTGWNNAARAVYNPSASSPNQATFQNSETNKPVLLETPEGTELTCSSTLKESTNTKPDNVYQYPLGLVEFCFNTESQDNEVSLIFVTDLKPGQVTARKYNSINGTYFDVPNATITETEYNGQPALKLTYTIQDNGQLDLDAEAGSIKDPVGLAVKAEGLAGTGQAVPLFVSLAVLSAFISALYLKRRYMQ